MKDIAIMGAGGFGREVQWLIERINEDHIKTYGEPVWNITGYIDDGIAAGTEINGYKVLGGIELLINRNTPLCVACTIGSSKIRKKVIDKIISNYYLSFPNLFDPSVQMSNRITWGKGNIVCAGNILTVNINISDFCIINLNCTLGHDAVLDSFVTLYPGVNISGNVRLNTGVEIGTGSHIIQGKSVGNNSITGAGSVVINDIPGDCTAVGIPCKPIKYHNVTVQ